MYRLDIPLITNVVCPQKAGEPLTPVTVTAGQTFDSRYGTHMHDDMIGKPFGSKILDKRGSRFLFLLRPTPSTWTLSLPHRTQILYLPDISLIISRLGITPGAKVIESGTGSGSMTHALAAAVATASQRVVRWKGTPGLGIQRGKREQRQALAVEEDADADEGENDAQATEGGTGVGAGLTLEEAGGPTNTEEGRVWSYEFHSIRARKAKSVESQGVCKPSLTLLTPSSFSCREEFLHHGLSPSIVALNHRNVCKNGFGLPAGLRADAAFLDLPAPWEAIPHARESLRTDVATRICSFSPCIEQVLKTVQAFHENGFSDVETYESLTREHGLATRINTAVKTVDDLIARLKGIEQNKARKREEQIKNAQLKKAAKLAPETVGGDAQEDAAAVGEKRAKPDSEGDAEGEAEGEEQQGAKKPRRDNRPPKERDESVADWARPEAEVSSCGRSLLTLRACADALAFPFQMRGHTSYLTFATLRPQTFTTPAKPVEAAAESAAAPPAESSSEAAVQSTAEGVAEPVADAPAANVG